MVIARASRADFDSELSVPLILLSGSARMSVSALLWLTGHLCLLLRGAGLDDAPFSRSPTLIANLFDAEGVNVAWARTYPWSRPVNVLAFWSIASGLVLWPSWRSELAGRSCGVEAAAVHRPDGRLAATSADSP